MPILDIKPPAACQFDLIALGEIMLRLDPGEGRIRCARDFKVWEGGGEYNVARGLRRCFGPPAGLARRAALFGRDFAVAILLATHEESWHKQGRVE